MTAMGGQTQYEAAIENYNGLPLNDRMNAADRL